MSSVDPFESSLWRAAPAVQSRRRVLIALVGYLVVIGCIAPWARTAGPPIPAAVGLLTGGIIICELATGLLLLAQPEARDHRSALLAACAYLLSASFAAGHLLTFPGAILTARAVVGGVQLGSYAYLVWRGAFAGLMLLAAILPDRPPRGGVRRLPVALAPIACIGVAAGLFAWAAINEAVLPKLVEGGRFTPLNLAMNWGTAVAALVACALFWRRGLKGSLLQLWLALAMTTFCGDLALSNFAGARFTWGWYAGRLSGLISALTLLVFFLIRSTLQQRQALAGAQALARQAADLRSEIARRTEAEERLVQAQKMEAIGQLTGGVAHDFNNLLTPIVGALDVLQRRGQLDDRSRRLIDGAQESAERARALVQRLLAFSRRQVLDPRPVHLGWLVENMRDLIAGSVGPRVRVEIHIEPDLPPVRIDPNQFELALLNLAVNARDAMQDEGVLTITARREQLAPGGVLPAGGYLLIEVKDTGVGMDPDTLKRAVDPFFTTKGQGRGTGLGLSMVHGLAGQLGGELSLASAPGLGTTAIVRLPQSQEPAAEEAPGPRQAAPVVHGAGQALLLVDDEPLVRAATAEMLTQIGYTVVEAASGDQALQLVRGGFHPAALVTDFAMPGMNGAGLAGELRRLKPQLPVLVMTGYANLAELDAGGWGRLAKPFRQAELAEKVARLLRGEGLARLDDEEAEVPRESSQL